MAAGPRGGPARPGADDVQGQGCSARSTSPRPRSLHERGPRRACGQPRRPHHRLRPRYGRAHSPPLELCGPGAEPRAGPEPGLLHPGPRGRRRARRHPGRARAAPPPAPRRLGRGGDRAAAARATGRAGDQGFRPGAAPDLSDRARDDSRGSHRDGRRGRPHVSRRRVLAGGGAGRVPDLQRPRHHGLRAARGHRRPARVSRAARALLHGRWRLHDGGSRARDGGPPPASHHGDRLQ